MSIIYCHICEEYIDTDKRSGHFDEHEEETEERERANRRAGLYD